MLDELLATAGVREVQVAGGPIGLMALHGGLEEGTFEIAEHVAARTGASLYAVVQPPDLRWHVPSIRYDPRHSDAMRRFLGSVRFAISVHGFGRANLASTALIGGRNRSIAERVAAHLGAHGSITASADPAQIPKRLRGLHARNPVNLPERAGVQLELTPDLRRTPGRERVAAALVDVVELLQRGRLGGLTTPKPEPSHQP